jgi:hypothetical protein
VGTTHFEDLNVFNVEVNDAYVRVSYEGSPSIALVSAPSRLRPSKDGFDPGAVIRLAFQPTAKGRANGTVIVHAAWQNGIRAPVDLKIPIEAAAHEVGGRSIAEDEAEERARKQEEREQRRKQEEIAHADTRTRERVKKNAPLYGSGEAQKQLQRAQKRVEDALLDVFDSRKTGVETAEKEAAKFDRRKPEHDEDLLVRLAWAALDVASVGIAGALGDVVKTALSKSTKNTAIVAFFTESVKDVAKRGGKAAIGAVKGKGAPKNQPGGSSDPLIAFFQTEKLSLIPQGRQKATAVAERTFDQLEPLLASSEEDRVRAVDTMDGIASSVKDLAKDEKPANLQAQASAMHWVQYMAQMSLGSVTAQEARATGKRSLKHGESTTNIAAANTASTSSGAPSAHDGLLDIEFHADVFHPERPATIVHARIHGVSNAIAQRLAEASLLTAGVPVRAYSRPGGATLEVIRDEAGNVDYVDNTGAPGMPGNWFARKVGEPHGGLDAELRGARKLIEQEIMAVELAKVSIETPRGEESLTIETDSDDKWE